MATRSGSFQCKDVGCDAVYRRKEHLTRHMASHVGPQRSPCPYCDSTLARSDLLRRHILKYHPKEKPPPSRAQKACRSCHARKERCDGEDPCNRCQRRGIPCLRLHQQKNTSDKRIETSTANPDPLGEVFRNDSVSDTSWSFLQKYIDIYFEKFHPIWPILPRGTFKAPDEPCVLLQSMLMIGLWIKGGQEGQNKAITFHRRLLSTIQAQKSQWYITDPTAYDSNGKTWPVPTYQSILLQLILALLLAQREGSSDFSFRFQLPPEKYELLKSLVETCRALGVFHYPNMLTQHASSTNITLIWVSVEELKRLGLALYKFSRLCSQSNASIEDTERGSGTGTGSQSELLTLADLDFCMPDSDYVWNATPGTESESVKNAALQQEGRDNRDPDNWISRTSGPLHDPRVSFDWI